MIIDALLTIMLFPLDVAIGLLPGASPLGLGSASGLLYGFAQFNAFIPLAEVVAVFALVLAVEVSVFGWKTLTKLWSLLPFT